MPTRLPFNSEVSVYKHYWETTKTGRKRTRIIEGYEQTVFVSFDGEFLFRRLVRTTQKDHEMFYVGKHGVDIVTGWGEHYVALSCPKGKGISACSIFIKTPGGVMTFSDNKDVIGDASLQDGLIALHTSGNADMKALCNLITYLEQTPIDIAAIEMQMVRSMNAGELIHIGTMILSQSMTIATGDEIL